MSEQNPSPPGRRRGRPKGGTAGSDRRKDADFDAIAASRGFRHLVRRTRKDAQSIKASEADLRRAGVVWNYPPAKAARPKPPNEAYARELARQNKAYAPDWWLEAMEMRETSAASFIQWRKLCMHMHQVHAAAFFRVPVSTIAAWEKGREMIPYAVTFMMRHAWRNDEIRLTRPGFHDWGIYYDHKTKQPKLYNKNFKVEFSAAQLIYFGQAMQQLSVIEVERNRLRAQVDALQVENTRLRELFKSQAVTGELRNMQARIDSLLARIDTADVIPFEPVRAAA